METVSNSTAVIYLKASLQKLVEIISTLNVHQSTGHSPKRSRLMSSARTNNSFESYLSQLHSPHPPLLLGLLYSFYIGINIASEQFSTLQEGEAETIVAEQLVMLESCCQVS
jgi:hypothetical protein